LQDIGIRSYTYISTLYKMMDAAAEYGKPVYILDRPNPMGGLVVDGNTVDSGLISFVGIVPVSYIHGCTIGELAAMINDEGWLPKDENGQPRKCNLAVIKMEGWRRQMIWEDTGLKWFHTSPNIPSVNAIRGAAVTGIFGELGIFNIGIGADVPFQFIGILSGRDFINFLDKSPMPGMALSFKKNKNNFGYQLDFDKDEKFAPYTSGIRIFLAIRKANPGLFISSNVKKEKKAMFEKVTGTKNIFHGFFENGSDEDVIKAASDGLKDYLEIRRRHLLYD
jgi:uncharacterized protein YbbC (DUF1343 family)